MQTIFLIKALLMGALPFYRIDFPLDVIPPELTYIEYLQGREINSHAIKESDELYMSLKKFLIAEKFGWRYDINTYAPNHIFSSDRIIINCLESAVVVNFRKEDDKKMIQISKKNLRNKCPIQ